MIRTQINAKLRAYAKTLSPSESEKNLVSEIYNAINTLLGVNNCIQIGSYPRYTSITPIHDLDVLYFLGEWNEKEHSPASALAHVYKLIVENFKNPTKYKFTTSLQTHSVTIVFHENGNEVFSVDIVPSYARGKNEFHEDTYMVPEVITAGNHQKRQVFYESHKNMEMNWILSDPRGYISVASQVGQNSDFRKAVKIVKRWKNNLSEVSGGKLKLKSFHLEQIVTGYFKSNNNIDVFDTIFKFFSELPFVLRNPNRIADRANAHKFIDDYIANLSEEDILKIIQARDCVLINFENIASEGSIEVVFKIGFYERKPEEAFLFDQNIKMLNDENSAMGIRGNVQPRDGGFRGYILDKLGVIDRDRKIKFEATQVPQNIDKLKWKVRNDNSTKTPRGEITDYRTRYDPESTKFKGRHFVQCYAVVGDECISKATQNVSLHAGD